MRLTEKLICFNVAIHPCVLFSKKKNLPFTELKIIKINLTVLKKITLYNNCQESVGLSLPNYSKNHHWCLVQIPTLGQQHFSVGPVLDQCHQTNNDVLPTTPCLQIIRLQLTPLVKAIALWQFSTS